MHLQELQESKNYRIGVISDTHGLLRSEALEALQGSDLIIHAGDVGKLEVLRALERISPVIAVRGNMDRGEGLSELPLTQLVQVGKVTIYVLHDLQRLDIVPKVAGVSLVISGHTHQPKEEYRDGVYFLNPGSAGPRRFSKPVCLAVVEVDGNELKGRLIRLET
jgi:putative phosphoesterase